MFGQWQSHGQDGTADQQREVCTARGMSRYGLENSESFDWDCSYQPWNEWLSLTSGSMDLPLGYVRQFSSKLIFFVSDLYLDIDLIYL